MFVSIPTRTARGCRVVLSPVENRIDDRPLVLARLLRAAMVSVWIELSFARRAASGAIGLFDSLLDFRTGVAFVVVFEVAVIIAAAGGVA